MGRETGRAVELATAWLSIHGRGFRYEYLSSRPFGSEWAVVFAVFTPNGYEMDGPYVLLVDEGTGNVRPWSP